MAEKIEGAIPPHEAQDEPIRISGELKSRIEKLKQNGERPFPDQKAFFAHEDPGSADYRAEGKTSGRYTHVGKIVKLVGGIMAGPTSDFDTPKGWAINVGTEMGQPVYQLIPDEMIEKTKE